MLGKANKIGPKAAATPPKVIIRPCTCGLKFLKPFDKSVINPASFNTKGAKVWPITIPAPSKADFIFAKLPAAVSSIIPAISLAVPSALPKDFAKSSVTPIFSESTSKALCALRPTSSLASAKLRPSPAKSAKALLTSPPVAPNSEIIRLKAVPACEPLIPLLAKAANIAVVSSKLTPAALATGATNFIES